MDKLDLTPTSALGVALSVAVPTLLMEDAQGRAEGMLDHLRRLGFDVVRTEPVTHPAGHAVEAMKRAVDTETKRLEAHADRADKLADEHGGWPE